MLSSPTVIRYICKSGDAFVTPSKSVRISGSHCLGPVVVNKEIADVPIGGVLEILTNDPCAKEDLRVWAKFTKNEIVKIEELGDGWMRFWILRKR